jgi:hypothetical protein
MQYACGIADATGVHRHINDLLLDLRGLTGVAILQQKRAPTAFSTLSAAIALLAFRRFAMSDEVDSLAIGAVEHLSNPRVPPSCVCRILTERISDPQL